MYEILFLKALGLTVVLETAVLAGAAATLLRIAALTGEVEPWRHLGLRLMEHVRRKLWQPGNATHAPVVPHARPEAKLATWCQAAEWEAAMLGEMADDVGALPG